jgi:hypothetical protein
MKLFEVIKDKKCVMSTEHKDAIYDEDILSSMKSAGYTFRLNGKSATVKEVVEFTKKK